MKRGNHQFFIVNKRLREAKAKFLIEHDKKEFKYCIITLYIEETPDTNIVDTSYELKQVLVHNCFSHPFRGVLGLIPFPKAIN